MSKFVSVGPKIHEMSPKTKEKVREDVQEAMAEKEEQGKSIRKLHLIIKSIAAILPSSL